jgi:hypothetical protein
VTHARAGAALFGSFALLAALTACGGEDSEGTLTRDDVPGATADPEPQTRLSNQAPCDELDQVEDDLVVRNDYTKEGGSAVTIKAEDDVAVDSSLWPTKDPEAFVSDIQAAVKSCQTSDAGATYEPLTGPQDAVGYRAVLPTNPEETRIERLFVPLDDQVAIVGVYDPQNAGSPEAADLVDAAVAAAKKADA